LILPWTRREIDEAEEFAQKLLAEAIARREKQSSPDDSRPSMSPEGVAQAKPLVADSTDEPSPLPMPPSFKRRPGAWRAEKATDDWILRSPDLPVAARRDPGSPATDASDEDDPDLTGLLRSTLRHLEGAPGRHAELIPSERWDAYWSLLEGHTPASQARVTSLTEELRSSLAALDEADDLARTLTGQALVRLAQKTARSPEATAQAEPLYTALLTGAERIFERLEHARPGKFSPLLYVVFRLEQEHDEAVRRRHAPPAQEGPEPDSTD
jgi:hypothetical protein